MFERKMNLDMKTRFNAMKKEKSDLQEEFLEMKVKFHRVKEESQDHVRIFFFYVFDLQPLEKLCSGTRTDNF